MALLFTSKALADAEITKMNAAMGIHANGNITATWDIPKQDANGKWVATKPEDRFMAGVVNYTEGAPVWPAGLGIGA